MTKKERIRLAMEGKTPDRVPTSFYTHFPDNNEVNIPDTIRWVKNSNMDMVCIEPDGYYHFWTDIPMRTIEDWKTFRPYTAQHPFVVDQLERAKRIREGLGDDLAVYYMFFTPLAFFRNTHIGGLDATMELWNSRRTELLQILDVMEESNFLFMDEMQKAGLDGLFVSIQHGETNRFTAKEYHQFLEPYDRRLIQHANGISDWNIGHLCSWAGMDENTEVDFGLWKDYPFRTMNWGIYQPGSMSMAEGRTFFPQSSAVMGGFDRRSCGILYRGTEQEIKTFTKDLIRETGDAGFILSADCSLQIDTPAEHLRWVVEAAEEFAQNQ